MKKNRIRLTESQLHNVIKECVEKVLTEGQGWNLFKDRTKQIWNGDFDEDLQNYQDEDWGEIKKDAKNYIHHGNSTQFDDDEYYDDEGNGTMFNTGNKINRGFSGKLGRAAGAAGTYASIGARHLYNKMRGKY